jgi:16S rRNA (cytosine1402-N4)-methyltransferase
LKTEYHIPVLLDTMIMYLLNPEIDKHIIVDGTLGGGGYSELIVNSFKGDSKLICIDKDINAINHSSKRLESKATNILYRQGNFADIKNIINEFGFSSVTGIVVDLGLSSYQLNHEEGFSFMNDTILDMRADKNSSLDAQQILNQYSESELTDIFESYGEIKKAGRLSRAIINFRKIKRIETTGEFIKIIQREYELKKSVPVKFLSKVFQALRIAVNDELNDLERLLTDSLEVLSEGGRIVVVSYHSLEDRIVKNFFKSREFKNEDEKGFKILTKKVVMPEYEEVRRNSKARSAKLRAAEVIVK